MYILFMQFDMVEVLINWFSTALILAWFEIGEICAKIIVVTRWVEVIFLRTNRLHEGWRGKKTRKKEQNPILIRICRCGCGGM